VKCHTAEKKHVVDEIVEFQMERGRNEHRKSVQICLSLPFMSRPSNFVEQSFLEAESWPSD
jgi:hypothetical protein